MSVQVEKPQLQTLLRERVFVAWVNSAGKPLTLGSCLHRNKQRPEFYMEAGYDMEGHVHIHFSLMATVMVAGESQPLEMLFVVPPNANFANAPMPLSKLDADDTPLPSDSFFPDASALHEAGISESAHVILVPFNLTAKGFVIMKNTSATVRPSSHTSNQLIRNLESLSDMSLFSVYIRPSDYAREGLKEICKRLSNTGVATHKTDMKEMYIQHGGMVVEWTKFRYRPRQERQPPPYTGNPALPTPEVQVPRSPPITLEREVLPANTIEEVIAETPTRSPVDPNPAPVLHGIFSSSAEVPSGDEVEVGGVEEDSISIEGEFDVDSAEEYLANLRPRELSQQSKDDLAVPKILESKLVEWLNGAITISPIVHKHKRLITKLSTLGYCIRTSNIKLFDATIPWCSALLFYDPLDSNKAFESQEEKNRWFISDMAELIKWANTFRYGVEISSLLINDFVKLGSAARKLALRPGYDKAEYNHQKCMCITRVLVQFGKIGNISGESIGPDSRKRATLEATGSTSKRARNII
ncbi:c1880106-b524-474b-9461-69bc9222f437 [Sclerotinia trifoliorum]|uniref:C1880106-b524-474b-9461-69bc9222f437 n=1 Tax=Sclerotinia trifoliorum TaxID=28548 RepID=A0A8H2VWJ1_9HELO|nr:c1880106-b524-474b-9461-69bc9222f437 [Sclerotinia trifoliorum]